MIRSLLVTHNRQTQLWLNLNEAASVKHRSKGKNGPTQLGQNLSAMDTDEDHQDTRASQLHTQNDLHAFSSIDIDMGSLQASLRRQVILSQRSVQTFPENSQTPGARQPDLQL